MKKYSQKGQSLFEVLFAVAMAALIVTAVASLATKSVNNTIFARNKSEATKLAQHGVEYVRFRRDSDPEGFFAGSNRPNSGDMNSELNCAATIFTCDLSITSGGSDILVVEVTVGWQDSTGTHNVVSKSYLTDYELY